jgi:hypothetical protein
VANYDSWSRSNYFKVKDIAKFKEFSNQAGFDVHEKNGRVCITPANNDGLFNYDLDFGAEDEDFKEDDYLLQQLAKHLCDNEVAVLLEVGHEKLRYVSGYAQIVNWSGEERYVSLTGEAEKHFKELGGDFYDDCY